MYCHYKSSSLFFKNLFKLNPNKVLHPFQQADYQATTLRGHSPTQQLATQESTPNTQQE